MDAANFSQAIASSNLNITDSSDLELFFKCWRLGNCESCLKSPYPCSWCMVSQVCVPNTRFNYPFGILAPIKDQNICPMGWRERWEMRAKPFSCRCSTMTLMSVVIAVLSTIAAIAIIQVLIVLGKWGWRKWRKRQPGWWKVHEYRLRFERPGFLRSKRLEARDTEEVEEGERRTEQETGSERQPLLG